MKVNKKTNTEEYLISACVRKKLCIYRCHTLRQNIFLLRTSYRNKNTPMYCCNYMMH